MQWAAHSRLWLWMAFILLCVVPWTSLQDHSHWTRVGWLPFVSPPIKLADIVGNVLLYVPFGYLVAQAALSRSGLVRALVYSGVLSVMTEASQLFSHSRFPSATDVACNLLGAGLGAVLLGRWSVAQEQTS